MARRTLKEARKLLDEAVPGLNPEMWKRFNDEVTAASQKAVVMANRYMDERVSQASAQGPELLTELCAVRDAYATLIKQGAEGRISAADYTKELHALQRRQRTPLVLSFRQRLARSARGFSLRSLRCRAERQWASAVSARVVADFEAR